MTKQNESKQGYKETKIGSIPEDWDLVRIKDCVLKTKGIDPTKTPDKQFKYVDISSICNGTYRIQEHQVIKGYNAPSRARKEIRTGDIIYATVRPYLKRLALVPKEYDRQICSTGFCVLRSSNQLKSRFLFYILSTDWITQRISRLQVGTNYPAVTDSDILCQMIPLPPKFEQDKICEVISSWDRAINKTQKLILSKRKLKKVLIHQLLTGKRWFKELKNQPWHEYHLGELFKERKERGREDLPLLAITSDRGVIYREEIDRKDSSSKDKSTYKRIAPGDIGYNTMRMWQGVSALSGLEGIVSPAYTICIPQKNKVDGHFAAYFFKYPPIVNLFYRYSQGLVSDTLNLKFPNFAQIKVRIPQFEGQKKIAFVLAKCDKEIDLLGQKLELLKQQKRSLMQKLLTGKIRVKV